MKTRRLLFLIPLCLLLASCPGMDSASRRSSLLSPAQSGSRLLLYMHSTSISPPDIEFTISEIALERRSGGWVKIMDEPAGVSAPALTDRQILLGEAFVEPGVYRAIKLIIPAATIRSADGRANLALAGDGGDVRHEIDLDLREGDSLVVSLIWNPDRSVEKRYIFNPSIEFEPQVPSARDLLLFISNSSSDYVSIIDRSLERVIAAVTVGKKPMGMALNSTKDTLYVVNSGERTVSVVDTSNFDVRDTIAITAGIGPVDMAFVPDFEGAIEGKLYVANRLSNDVAVISTQARRLLKTVAVGRLPSHIASDEKRREVYVTNELSNSLSIISAVDDTVVSTVKVDNAPGGVAVGDEFIYVFNGGSNTVSVVSPVTRATVETVIVSRRPHRGLKAFGRRLFIADTSSDEVTFLNSFNVVTNTVSVGKGPVGLAGDERRNRLYVTNSEGNTVSVLDPVGEMVVKELTVGSRPYGAVQLDR